jgi:hypothetical protein
MEEWEQQKHLEQQKHFYSLFLADRHDPYLHSDGLKGHLGDRHDPYRHHDGQQGHPADRHDLYRHSDGLRGYLYFSPFEKPPTLIVFVVDFPEVGVLWEVCYFGAVVHVLVRMEGPSRKAL